MGAFYFIPFNHSAGGAGLPALRCYAWEVSNDPKKSRIAGKVGIAKLPHFNGGKSYSTLGGWQFGINRYSKNPDLAWKFISFMTSPEIQKFLAMKAAQPPTRLKLYEDKEISNKYPHFVSLRDVFMTSYPRPRSPFYPAISNILQRYFSKSLADRESNIEALSKEAETEINSLMEKYDRL